MFKVGVIVSDKIPSAALTSDMTSITMSLHAFSVAKCPNY